MQTGPTCQCIDHQPFCVFEATVAITRTFDGDRHRQLPGARPETDSYSRPVLEGPPDGSPPNPR
jgi:hypothetical protein